MIDMILIHWVSAASAILTLCQSTLNLILNTRNAYTHNFTTFTASVLPGFAQTPSNATTLPIGSCTGAFLPVIILVRLFIYYRVISIATIPCGNGACCNAQSGFCGFVLSLASLRCKSSALDLVLALPSVPLLPKEGLARQIVMP